MSNLKFKTAPTFEKLTEFFNKTNREEKILANNTVVKRYTTPDGKITDFSIYYHGNLISVINPTVVYVSNAGYGTVTTRDRINKILDANDIHYSVGQKNFAQTFDKINTYPEPWINISRNFVCAYFSFNEYINSWVLLESLSSN